VGGADRDGSNKKINPRTVPPLCTIISWVVQIVFAFQTPWSMERGADKGDANMKLAFGRPEKTPRDYFTYRIEDIITREGEALSLVEDSMTHAEFVDHCVSNMPKPEKPKRDLRRRDIERSLQNMCDRGRLPFAVSGDRFVF
jgi:hypothetical protein